MAFKQEKLTSSEQEIVALKRENARLRVELRQAQDFFIVREKKNIEYIYHIAQFRSSLHLKIENWISRLLGVGRKKNPIKQIADQTAYSDWIVQYDDLSLSKKEKIANCIEGFTRRIQFSLVIFYEYGSLSKLESSIKSVKEQLYRNWEIIVVGEKGLSENFFSETCSAPELKELIKFVEANQVSDPSDIIKIVSQKVTGDFVAVMRAGDTISPTAFFEFAAEIDLDPALQCIYCDEDMLDWNGQRILPCFKTDWNLELFLAQNYVGALCFIRRDFFTENGNFLSLQDCIEALYFRSLIVMPSESIRHVAAPLFHRAYCDKLEDRFSWMRRSESLVQDYYDTRGIKVVASKLENNPDWIEVRRALPDPIPLVTIIIPTHNRPDLLSVCLEGVLSKTNYHKIEIIIIDHENDRPDAISLLQNYGLDERIKIIHYQGIFDHSLMNNEAAKIAQGDILLFLNDDIEIIDTQWLSEIVSQFTREDCGVVGAKLLYPNGKIQHAGIILGYGGVAGHAYVGRDQSDPGYFGRLLVVSEVSALTGACMAIRRKLFDDIGGFSAKNLQRTFNDVDLCLKARAKGMVNIFTPRAKLVHHESATDGGDLKLKNFQRLQGEVSYMFLTWGLMRSDPYYNVNMSLEDQSFELAFPPRHVFAWDLSGLGEDFKGKTK